MGVKGLWELLSPVGRRINIETLEGKILAIDASIWITQFIKAMRDDEGKIVKNAHLLGTLRRILKLLHNRIRTVFVFDGATPMLKIQTVRARRLLREKQEINVKKSAERLLLEKIKRHILAQSGNSSRPSKIAPEFHPPDSNHMEQPSEVDHPITTSQSQTNPASDSDEWEEGYSHLHDKDISRDSHASNQSRSRNGESDEDEEDWVIPEHTDEIDSGTLASLPPGIRKHVIEEARKKESRKNRAHYLPVAADPLLYSKTQIANFLRTSKFNQVVLKTQEETDRLEREKFGSGHLISGDGNRRYILKKEDQKDESADDDLSWLNDDSEDESRLPKKSIHPENPNSPLRSKKRARVVSDESESENEGGFFKPHSPKAQIHNGITPTKQWMCPSCTLYNDMADSICSMCGHSSSMPFAAPSSNSHPESFDKEEIEVLETPPSAVSEPQEPNNNQNFVEEESALKSNSQSSDEWEDNHYENVLEDTCEKNDESVDPTPPQQCLNEDIITRAVLSASNMGDWAGRAVRRALQANNPQSTRVVPSEKDTVSNVEVDSHHPTNELQNLFGPTQHELTADGGFMREGANERVVQSNDNGFEVDELEFERKALRDVDVLNDGMVNDIKALLDAFDIPYISAPFEAEAQCAFLEMAGLVDGIVTEDSDVFLFGGRCVYKNIFEDKKYVEVYLAEDLKRDLGVDRSDLITLAYLLGSDYTDGVKGIGIVNAMEIIDVFGSQSKEKIQGPNNNISIVNQGGFFVSTSSSNREEIQQIQKSEDQTLLQSIQQLESFKEWLLAPYDFSSLNIFKTKKRKNLTNHDDEEELSNQSQAINDKKLEEFSKKHIGMRKKWTVKDSFPDRKIAEAYLSPQVNKLKEKFHFENPKLFKIKKYVSQTLGWTEDEISKKITPVIQRFIEERGTTQSRIDSFFLSYHDNKRFASIQSERLKGAVTRVKERQKEG